MNCWTERAQMVLARATILDGVFDMANPTDDKRWFRLTVWLSGRRLRCHHWGKISVNGRPWVLL